MCLFPHYLSNPKNKAYQKGIEFFECGGCPECLNKKARYWALRCTMEAKTNPGMMLTLTYDTYQYDEKGNIIGENLRNDLTVNKKDVQNFIKRLRFYYPDKPIKYLVTAEYGKRTHRPHYHALIFGVVFDDLIYYKRSKRGNVIYRSATLEKIWQGGKNRTGGICTVDSINLSAKMARYCTKYCCKDQGIDDTFMLFSRGIGDEELMRRFNGISYVLDGKEYPIPKLIWQKHIEEKKHLKGYFKYRSLDKLKNFFGGYDYSHLSYKQAMRLYLFGMNDVDAGYKYYFVANEFEQVKRQRERNRFARMVRDHYPLYQRYIEYWKRKNEVAEITRPSVFDRIRALPDNKYRSYKYKALQALNDRISKVPYVPPRSNSYAEFKEIQQENERKKVHLPYTPSRHYTANDSPHISGLIKKDNGAIAVKVFDPQTGRTRRISLENGPPLPLPPESLFVKPEQIAWSDVENVANLQ